MKKLTTDEQLNLCELLALSYDSGSGTHDHAKKIIDNIYRIAHLNGRCKNPHNDWHNFGHKVGRSLKQAGVGNYKTNRKRWEGG